MMETSEQTNVDIDAIRMLISDVMDIDEVDITPEARFIDDLGMDSLMALEIMVALEKKYGIKIKEDDLKALTCLKNVHELLENKIQARGAQ